MATYPDFRPPCLSLPFMATPLLPFLHFTCGPRIHASGVNRSPEVALTRLKAETHRNTHTHRNHTHTGTYTQMLHLSFSDLPSKRRPMLAVLVALNFGIMRKNPVCRKYLDIWIRRGSSQLMRGITCHEWKRPGQSVSSHL